MATKNAIESARKYLGYTQADFAEFAGEHTVTYSRHEFAPDDFRLGELSRIAGRLTSEQQKHFASAVVEMIFGEQLEKYVRQ